jgi:hypothetical protein
MRGALAVLIACAARAAAQGAYEIQVYPSQTAAPGVTFVELHSNTATKGPPNGPGGLQPDVGAFHETLEVTRGFTDWFETGFYVFSSARSGEGWQWVGDHVRPRVMAPTSWGWPVGVSLSVEGGYLRDRFADTRWDLEIRPIVDWRSGPLYLSFNPALERGLVPYPGGSTRFVFAPAAKASYDATRLLALGFEYYASLPSDAGPEHQLFVVGDLAGASAWEVNAGVGFGLTRQTDALLLKLIVGRRFP